MSVTYSFVDTMGGIEVFFPYFSTGFSASRFEEQEIWMRFQPKNSFPHNVDLISFKQGTLCSH